jgi:uncharacterized membrane protein YhhN
MIPVFILFLLFAALEWVAVARGWKRVEYIGKPAPMLILLAFLAFAGGFGSPPLICFGLGIFFSLVGDVLLLIPSARGPDARLIPGLVAFLLAHVSYIIGLNIPFPNSSPIWSLGLAIILALSAARILKRILDGVLQKGLQSLVRPVALYGVIITLMLLSALLTLNNSTWKISAAGLVAVGAVLFYFSDMLLAWVRFVKNIKNGPLTIMILYHLGQAALVAGVLLQFKK